MRCIYQTIPQGPFSVKVISPNQFGEYAVRLYELKWDGKFGPQGCSTYYTTDRDDAIQTANATQAYISRERTAAQR